MTTSGLTGYQLQKNQIIQAAYEKINVVPAQGLLTANQIASASVGLNLIVTLWETDGMPLWAIKQGYIMPVTNTNTIAHTGNITNSYVNTTTTETASLSQTTITLTSVSGISAGSYIGICQSDNSMFWTTVNGAPSGLTITLTTGFTVGANSGAQVYSYVTGINYPLKIHGAWLLYTAEQGRHPINIISKERFFNLGNINSKSIPNQIAYDPQLGSGYFYIYPEFQGGDNIIQIAYQTPFEYFNASTDTPYFPPHWGMPLVYALAAYLMDDNEMDIQTKTYLQQQAMSYKEMAYGFGIEEASLLLTPEYNFMHGNVY